MKLASESLVVVGCVCIVISLIQAWSLSAMRYLQIGWVKRLFRNYRYLLKSHIDFLMMAGLLFAVLLLFRHFRVEPPGFVVAALCAGSLLNPLGFMAIAIWPELLQTPTSGAALDPMRAVVGAIMSASFVVTTVGYGSAAWLIGCAAVAAT